MDKRSKVNKIVPLDALDLKKFKEIKRFNCLCSSCKILRKLRRSLRYRLCI